MTDSTPDTAGPLPGELDESIAPAPTAGTVRMRTNLPYQLYRFARVNMRMVKMIRKSHVH